LQFKYVPSYKVFIFKYRFKNIAYNKLMLKLTRFFLSIIVVMAVCDVTLWASQQSGKYHKVIELATLHFNEVEPDISYDKKAATVIKNIKDDTSAYKEYLVELIGDTSCGERYEEYASHVEDALIDGGIAPQKIKRIYLRTKNGGGDCAQSRSVKVKLYLGEMIDNDVDKDGVPNSIDKCPDTPKNSIVSEDGCVHKTSVILLSGRKKHTAIVLETAKGSLLIDKPLEVVTLNANETISKPKKIDKKELHQMMGAVIASSNEKQYRYVFYFTGTKLRAESKKRVDEMLQKLDSLKDAYITIIGNTDTYGTVEDNRILGLKRAQTIADIINAAGVKYLKMDLTSHSELDLAVPTKDETREPLNRRVEVLIQ